VADIFKEVDEDVRRDQMVALWRRYRWAVIAGVSLVVLGTAAGVGWREYTTAKRAERGAAFAAAAELAAGGREGEAAQAFDALAKDAGDDLAALARLREAAALAASGDGPGAVAVYDRIAADGSVDPVLREFADLLAARRQLDDGDAAAAERRVTALASGAGPWRHLAREVEGIAALQDGRTTEARAIFKELAEEAGVSAGVKRRAREVLAALGEEATS